jgi:acetyl esterase/lipase
LQFYRECAHYAAKGMVAVAAEYRISYLHKTTPFESFEDAKDAIRWLRQHASELNIDPNRIVAAGASAGGHLAAATGIIKENSNEKTVVSSKPNLLLLYYPVIDNGPDGYGPEEMKKRFQEISPLHNIDSTAPPTLFFLGTNDQLIPVKTAEEFKMRMEKAGKDCELHLFEGAGHPIFYYAKELPENYFKMLELSDRFLRKNGYLKD